MDYIIKTFNERLLSIDKEIFRILENEWKIEYLNMVCNDIRNIDKHMLGLANSIKLNNYTNIENIYASIIVNSRRNKAKIIFDLDSSYLKIIEILNKEKEEIINDLKKIDELRKLSRNYKTALLDLKYNEKVMPKTIDFIKNNFGNK